MPQTTYPQPTKQVTHNPQFTHTNEQSACHFFAKSSKKKQKRIPWDAQFKRSHPLFLIKKFGAHFEWHQP